MAIIGNTGRWGALALAGGALLFGLASLFHPPTVNPWDPTVSLAEATKMAWVIDHWALLAAVILVYSGLLIFHGLIGRHDDRGDRSLPYALAVVSFALWAAIFLFEATGWPILGKALEARALEEVGARTEVIAPAATVLTTNGALPDGVANGAAAPGLPSAGEESLLWTLARTLWAPTISLGYAAAFLLGAAVLLWACELAALQRAPSWLAQLGMVAGAAVAVAQPIALGVPRYALWLLVPAAALMGAWMLAAAWWMWRAGPLDVNGR